MPLRHPLLLLALLSLAVTASAQSSLRVAYDCQQVFGACDRDFFQTELPYVQFVRDQGDADLFVLITSEATGGGGRRYSLFFQGRRTYEGQETTLAVSVPTDASDDDQRRAIASRLSLGLAPFVAQTPAADQISIAYEAPVETASPEEPQVDPWNGWVFRMRGSTFFNGQSQSSSFSGNGNLSASRVTETWKTRISTFGSFDRSEFEIDSVTTIVSEQSRFGASGLAVRSLGPRLSAGVRAGFSRNTFSNYDARVTAGPAVEASLYPYTEATRRLVTARYAVEVEAAAYADTTIFGVTSEVLPQHTLRVGAELAQPWGSLNVSVNGQQYLTKLDKYEVGVFGGLNVRLARGLQLNLGGSASYVRNQLSLPAGGLTPEEILTEQRELATSFRYFGNVGLSYSFGSIFNSAVNNRFNDGGRVFFF